MDTCMADKFLKTPHREIWLLRMVEFGLSLAVVIAKQ